MRSLLLVLCVLLMRVGGHAQSPDIDAWMVRHFSGKASVKQDHKADEALYAAMGLDSLRSNRFIGLVTGTMKLADGTHPAQFTLWCDTLEALLQYYTPGDTTTFHADLRTNTITFSATGTTEGEVNSSINDLRERAVVNRYRYADDGSPWRVIRRKAYESNGGILGQDMSRWAVVQGDTIRFLRREHGNSPFVDALEWLPYGGDYPFNLIMQLARAGDPMPVQLKSAAGSVQVQVKHMTPQQRPAYRIGANVTDTRTKAHHALPIRKRNARAYGFEIDPPVDLPEWSGSGLTGDPGRPDEPDVTFSGPRLRMRIQPKEPCGDTGTVVVRVWIDRKGLVQLAEFDKGKSTLHAKTCVDQALLAAKKDTYYPMEGGMPLDKGEVVFEYRRE